VDWLASTNQSARRLNPEEHHHYRYRRENLKSHMLNVLSHPPASNFSHVEDTNFDSESEDDSSVSGLASL
jgi:hypothetical protein